MSGAETPDDDPGSNHADRQDRDKAALDAFFGHLVGAQLVRV